MAIDRGIERRLSDLFLKSRKKQAIAVWTRACIGWVLNPADHLSRLIQNFSKGLESRGDDWHDHATWKVLRSNIKTAIVLSHKTMDTITKDIVAGIDKRFTHLEERINALQREKDELESIVQANVTDKCVKEVFYQKWLETVLGGKHKKLSIGVTDVSTSLMDVEIKTWRKWSMAIAQVDHYNRVTKAELKVLALFDVPDGWIPPVALIDACDRSRIRPIVLHNKKLARGLKTGLAEATDFLASNDDIRNLFETPLGKCQEAQILTKRVSSSNIIEQWLVHMVKECSLPTEPVSASTLLVHYNTWLKKFAPENKPVRSKNFLYPHMKPYFGRGVQYDTEPGRPAYYRFV